MRRKIFIVGFNKCGTTSLHVFFQRNGLRVTKSGRSKPDVNIAFSMLMNFNLARPILNGHQDFDVYSDIIYSTSTLYIEGARFFKEIHEQFPDGYYILNTRDVDNWIRSRLRHKEGSFAKRTAQLFNVDTGNLEGLWRQQFEAHNQEVRDYFKGTSNFIEFNIEKEPITTLCDFLAPDYELNAGLWQHKNRTVDVA